MALSSSSPVPDALACAQAVARGESEPSTLVQQALSRIAETNPRLGAVVRTFDEYALTLAHEPLPDGPLRGVPILLKDLLASLEGDLLTSGSRLLSEHRPLRSSTLVKRLLNAGVIPIGRTNTPEFGLLPTTEPALFGPTRNPWGLDRTPGGSSGGAAAAVASGMITVAHGGDGGGSIRIPASCCGLYGLKPSRGRTPLEPEHTDILGGVTAEHVITRSVRDSAVFLDVLEGHPETLPHLNVLDTVPARQRIIVPTDWRAQIVHPEVREAVDSAASLLSELGHDVCFEPLKRFQLEPFYQAQLPIPLGHIHGQRTELDSVFEDLYRFAPFTAPFNLTGQPAASLPLFWAADGLPVGVQLAGPVGRDDLVLQLSRQLELAQSWAHHTAPILDLKGVKDAEFCKTLAEGK